MSEHFYTYPTVIEVSPWLNPRIVRAAGTDHRPEPTGSDRAEAASAHAQDRPSGRAGR